MSNTCLAHAVANRVTANVTTEVAFRPPLFYGLLVFSILQLLAWLLPNHHYPWVTFYQDLLSATALLFLAVSLFITNKKIQIPWLSILAAAIALIPFIQWQAGIIPFAGDAIMSSLYISGLAGAIIVGYNLKHSQYEIFNILAYLFIIGGLFSTYFAMHQWLELSGLSIYISDIQNNSLPYANFAQPNNLATFILCSLISLVYLWEKNRISSTLTAFFAPLLLLGLALPQSRTTWAIAIVLGIWWLFKGKTLHLRIKSLHLVIAVLIYASFIFLKPVIEEYLLIDSYKHVLSTDIGPRGIIWSILLDAVWSGPWWGYGWQPVSNALVSAALDHPKTVLVHHSHNLLIELWVWNGPWLGSLIILFSMWWFINQAVKINSKKSWFAFAIILAMTTHAMLELPLHYAFFLLPFGLLVGYVEQENNTLELKTVFAPRFVMIGITFSALLFIIALTYEYKKIENDFNLMRFETARIGPVKAKQLAPDVVLLTQLSEYIRFARTEATRNMGDNSIEHMENVAHRYGYPSAMFRYSLALGLNDRYKDASIELQRIRKIHGDTLYQEAKDNWAILSKKYPELKAVSIP